MPFGIIKLTLNEAGARLAFLMQRGNVHEARAVAFSYYTRWALSFAPLVIGLFALAVAATTRRTITSLTAATVGPILYYAIGVGVVRPLPSEFIFLWPSMALSVWLPNIVLAGLTIVLFMHSNAWAIWSTPKSS